MAAVEEQRLENGETDKRDARDPSGFLSEILGAPVTVKLNSGTVFKGEFVAFLSYLYKFASPALLSLLVILLLLLAIIFWSRLNIPPRLSPIRRRLHEHLTRTMQRVCLRQGGP